MKSPKNPLPPHSSQPSEAYEEGPALSVGALAKVLSVLGLISLLFVLAISVVGFVAWRSYQNVQQAKQAQFEKQRALELEQRKKAEAALAAARQASEEAANRRQAQEAIRLAEAEAERRQREEELQASREEFLAEQKAREEARRQEREEQLAAQRKQQLEMKQQRSLQTLQNALLKTMQLEDPAKPLFLSQHSASKLSWRVQLLPVLGYARLHAKFDHSVAWNESPNRELLQEMPEVFGEAADGTTRIRSVIRQDGARVLRLGDLTDGENQFATLVHAGASLAIPWTQPDSERELSLLSIEHLALKEDEPLMLAAVTGTPRRVFISKPSETPDQLYRALVSTSGGEILDFTRANKLSDAKLLWAPTSSQRQVPEQQQVHRKLADLSLAIGALYEEIGRVGNSHPALSSQLSWHVQLLPYLGFPELYQEFDHRSAWDSEHNLTLLGQMPDEFATGTAVAQSRFQLVNLQSFAQPRMPCGLPLPSAFTDSAEHCAWIFLAAPHRATAWTDPTLLRTRPPNIAPGLGWPTDASLLSATLSGKPFQVPGTAMGLLYALLSPSGGERFELGQALQNPNAPLELMAEISPASSIEGVLEALPDVALPTQSNSGFSASEQRIADRLRTLALAVHNFYSTYRRSPGQLTKSNGTASELSWRVHVLPYIEQTTLYEKFHLDEPWDSEHNLSLAAYMPPVFGDSSQGDTTRIVAPGGPSTLLGTRNLVRVSDGLDHTLMLTTLAPEKAVPWTKPDRLPELQAARDFVEPGEASFLVALGNSAVVELHRDIPQAHWQALITPEGGELVDAQLIRRWSSYRLDKVLEPPSRRGIWQGGQLKELSLGWLNYYSNYRAYPPIRAKAHPMGFVDPTERMLSWRVHILPYIGFANLYEQFRLDEPWDSPHNAQLLNLMPDCYRGIDDPTQSTQTQLVTCVGAGSLFPKDGSRLATKVPKDGARNTISLLRVPRNFAVPWTQPADFEIDLLGADTLDELRQLTGVATGLQVALYDGSVKTLLPNTNPKILRSLLTVDGGELLDLGEIFSE